jgi:hypothetical protein
LLLVVIGGRSLIGGALVAGGLFAAELLPSTGTTGRYLPLGVAAAVVVVAQYPEGILAFIGSRLQGMTGLLRRLPPSPAARGGGDEEGHPVGRAVASGLGAAQVSGAA